MTENLNEETLQQTETKSTEAQSTDKTDEQLKVEVKTYTEEEVARLVNEKVNDVLPSKIARAKAKVEKEYREKYGKTEELIKAGSGANTLEEATTKLEELYKEKGINLPTEAKLTARQIEVLADAEAEEIIQAGYDEVVEEVERLTRKGTEKMSDLEKKIFIRLAETRKQTETVKELESIGVGADILESKDFKEFKKKLNPNLSIKESYELYEELKPKEKVEIIGSQTSIPEKTVKGFYTPEEARALSKKDLDNPTVYENVRKSMTEWYKNK